MSTVSNLPSRADVVVIGAGIVGSSLVHHLAALGWRDIVLLDKGTLPDPGGSTGHASNFLFPVNHSKELTLLTLDSMRQYEQLGTLTTCGGIEIAREPERLEELKRRMASATSWGVPAELISPAEVARHVPFVDEKIILGGFWTPSVAVVDSVRSGGLMRERARASGALTICAPTEVLDIQTRRGQVSGVRTDRGDIDTDTVVIACGVWSPRLARMAGARIPLSPVVHQMIDFGPIPELDQTGQEIAYPIIRDMDTMMYERQHGAYLMIGSHAHRSILHEPDDIPSIESAQLSPTQLPFTPADFAPQMADAHTLLGKILSSPGAHVRRAINGLLAMTPDGHPLLGETVEVKGLWSAAAAWIREGPSVGRMVAEWMTDGAPEIDLHEADIARFYPHERTRAHVRARAAEGFPKLYGIAHPRDQWASSRQQRLSPFYLREQQLEARFFEVSGWEQPEWYESNHALLAEFADRVEQRSHAWDSRWWSPIISAEHLAMRARVAMIDLSAFAQFEVSGFGVLDYLQYLMVARVDHPVGRVVCTPMLAPNGGFRGDLTLTRVAEHCFRIITGAANGGRDRKWLTDHLPEDGSVSFTDLTSQVCTIGLWGPRARDLLSSATEDDVSPESFPFATARHIAIGAVPALALRTSYVGELGWELHAPVEQGLRLWDILADAGQRYGVVPAGNGVYGTTARLEKSYCLMGNELQLDYDPVEAGLGLPEVKACDFIGKDAYLRARDRVPAAILCTFTVDDHVDSRGVRRDPQGSEPILTTDGKRIVDRKGRASYVTSAGAGPSVGAYLLMAYVPPEYAVEGTALALEYMGERYPVTLARVGRTPLFDPDDQRLRA